MPYGYMVVEGQHDLEYVGRLLKAHGMERTRRIEELESFWNPLVPRTFPYQGDLLKRVPVPVFFRGNTFSVAVQAAEGDVRLTQSVEETLLVLPGNEGGFLSWIGVLLDADHKHNMSALARFRNLRNGLVNLGIEVPELPREVSRNSPRCGIFVLPDNDSAGALEDILIECGDAVYPQLMDGARTFLSHVDSVRPTVLRRELGEFDRVSGRNKALVGCVMQVLKPGKASQVSIQDNRWIGEQTIQKVANVRTTMRFIQELLGVS
jgi:hypothetical protein